MPDVGGLLILIGSVLVAIVVGYLIFNKLQKGFAEEL
jgi:ABC-type polysaccharide/polyol phosphate export permease